MRGIWTAVPQPGCVFLSLRFLLHRHWLQKCRFSTYCSWYLAHRRPWTEIHILAKGGWVGWGGILTFMYLAYIRGCYAAAMSLGMGGVGGDINVHVPCLHTWMLRCCYVTGHGWGGGDINVHVPCLHTWMLRCCYVTGHGWGGGGY